MPGIQAHQGEGQGGGAQINGNPPGAFRPRALFPGIPFFWGLPGVFSQLPAFLRHHGKALFPGHQLHIDRPLGDGPASQPDSLLQLFCRKLFPVLICDGQTAPQNPDPTFAAGSRSPAGGGQPHASPAQNIQKIFSLPEGQLQLLSLVGQPDHLSAPAPQGTVLSGTLAAVVLAGEESGILRQLQEIGGGFHRPEHISAAEGDAEFRRPGLLQNRSLGLHGQIRRGLQPSSHPHARLGADLPQVCRQLVLHLHKQAVRHGVRQHSPDVVPLLKIRRGDPADLLSHRQIYVQVILRQRCQRQGVHGPGNLVSHLFVLLQKHAVGFAVPGTVQQPEHLLLPHDGEEIPKYVSLFHRHLSLFFFPEPPSWLPLRRWPHPGYSNLLRSAPQSSRSPGLLRS